MKIVGVQQIVKSVQVLSHLSDDTFNTADCGSGIMHKHELKTSRNDIDVSTRTSTGSLPVS